MALARIGLGSNVGDAAANVRRAIDALAALGTVAARSSLYRSEPRGLPDQPDFVNAAALLATALEPRALLAALDTRAHVRGRVEPQPGGPRLSGLDILAYDDLEMREPGLTIPHERLFERAFALAPLAEIDPAFQAANERLPREDRARVRRIAAGGG